MIQLTRINLVPFYLNQDLIEHMETTPDTVISLTTGQKFVVVEPAEQVIERIVAFRRRIGNPLWSPPQPAGSGGQGE
jgi:flagellar protein FlbD